MTGFWQALIHNWIQWTQETTQKWRMRRKKWNCTKWPRIATFWKCGRAAETYMLPRRNLAIITSSWLLGNSFQTRKRSSEHCSHSFNMVVWLHLNCKADLLCHHICLQRTSLEAELKYWIFSDSEESTIIQLKVMRIAYLTAFRTLKIGITGMGT